MIDDKNFFICTGCLFYNHLCFPKIYCNKSKNQLPCTEHMKCNAAACKSSLLTSNIKKIKVHCLFLILF